MKYVKKFNKKRPNDKLVKQFGYGCLAELKHLLEVFGNKEIQKAYIEGYFK